MAIPVSVRDLVVAASGPRGELKTIVDSVSFDLKSGQVLALIGESGSGKTTIALSLLGHARRGCSFVSGSVLVGDQDVLKLTKAELTSLRGKRVSYVAQSAAAAFNPARNIISQVIEPAIVHGFLSEAEATERAVELFREMALPYPESIGERYPHQVSGGQLQRLMAVMALITDPELVVFDEPTTALDVTTQVEVLLAFKKAIRVREISAVYVSHDLSVVAQMADQVVVLQQGKVREQGACRQVLENPTDEYTQMLVAAAEPVLQNRLSQSEAVALLEVTGLSAVYGAKPSGKGGKQVLFDVNLKLHPGSTVGVIGESGSGKSTLARVIAGLHTAANGTTRLSGQTLDSHARRRSVDELRRMQIVFQNADTALNPAHRVEQILARPLAFYHGMDAAAQQVRIAELLELVQLPPSIASSRCQKLSGGQKQRINLARALAAEPDIIICDEVTSALDTIVGAAILEMLAELQKKLGVSLIFISHDISMVQAICDEILVLYQGRAVEQGTANTIQSAPRHPYTETLMESVPELRNGWLDEVALGRFAPTTPDASVDEELCAFLPRCPRAIKGVCDQQPVPIVELSNGKNLLCHAVPLDSGES